MASVRSVGGITELYYHLSLGETEREGRQRKVTSWRRREVDGTR